jgi:hypothetical protein
MSVVLTDDEIARLVAEHKVLPSDYQQRLRVRPRSGHKEQELNVEGSDGSEFRLILRLSDFNPLDFSVVLGYCMPKSNVVFRLRRYNGKHGEHTNTLERETFYDFHIHMATERYQQSGLREDTYAERTDRYADFAGALRCMLDDCGFVEPPGTQAELRLR